MNWRFSKYEGPERRLHDRFFNFIRVGCNYFYNACLDNKFVFRAFDDKETLQKNDGRFRRHEH